MAQLLKVAAIPFPLNLRRNGCRTSSPRFHRATTLALTTHDAHNTTKRSSFHGTNTRKLPIILFDIMDTVVRDPFYHDVPAFFRMSFEELIESKHPTAWIEFEKGITDEMELARTFFKDGRPIDLEGLKNCMKKGYSYVEGVEELLDVLKHNNYEMHAFTNYPIWLDEISIFCFLIKHSTSSFYSGGIPFSFLGRYEMIEDKLNISKYLSWTFCSCITGKRKPDPEFYLEVVRHLEVDPGSCIFVDDRMRNVEAAKEVGIVGLHFKNADSLRQDLLSMGIDISTKQTNLQQE
ncbi:LOW QUALITY PROTEIN: flavin mononucleotide hydrolase 1, chloroplatic [Pyrus x bretschneideri]|uniref:LOW QUALITY PROTEIN: flavin mononucleotide hydrolase 1, chloroplatic n=1 Tax=Pyrus x bretschneideri TaxID=225117 RepID=UPI00203085E0|nr:LOW QUALITY PROTEIN: flavin mononucleotide hydrolase 1, chloroplatic [Pyrus x bretschneideri]